jgi:toxin ParE1/3/4
MRVRYTPRARADLREIFAYLYDRSPQGAKNVRAAIRIAADLLGKDPGRGQTTSRLEVRRIPVVRYRYAIYFRVRGEDVQIVHIRHTSRLQPGSDEL